MSAGIPGRDFRRTKPPLDLRWDQFGTQLPELWQTPPLVTFTASGDASLPGTMHTRQSTTRTLLSIGSIQIAIMVVAMARGKTMSILLGPAGFGVVSTIDLTILTLVNLGALSLPFTALKFMARSHSVGTLEFQDAYASFFRALLTISIAVVLGANVLLLWAPGIFGTELLRYRPFFFIGVLQVPAILLNIFFINTLAAAQRSTDSAMVALLVTVGLAAAATAGVVTYGIQGLYIASVLAGLLTTVATMVFLRRRLALRSLIPTTGLLAALRQQPEILSYSLLLYIAMAAYSLTMLATRYFVFEDLGAETAGFLQALVSIALAVGAVITPMSGLYLAPLVNRQIPTHEKVAAASAFVSKVSTMLLLMALPVILFPRVALSLLFSERFSPVSQFLFSFIAWQCLYQLVNVYLQLLIGLDDILYFSIATCVAYACTALLFPILIPKLGLSGAAVALFAGMAVCGVMTALRLRFRFGSPIAAGVLVRASYLLAIIGLAGVLFDPQSELTMVGTGVRVAFALVACGVLWFLLAPDERQFAVDAYSRLRRHWGGP